MSPERREAQAIVNKAIEQVRAATNPFINTPNTKATRRELENILEGIMRSVARDLGAIFIPDVEVSSDIDPHDIRIRFFFDEDELKCDE